MKSGLLFIASVFVYLLILTPIASAAPIGLPGASKGVDQSSVGLEFNFVIDHDLDQSKDTEGMSVLAKGEVGVSERVDLLFRFGLGRFESGDQDSDIGPAYGFGTKITWAEIEDLNIKIGSVAQMLQMRADFPGKRGSFLEYDFALGAFHDGGESGTSGKRQFLKTYGGILFSSVDVDGKLENSSFGVFVGLLMNLNKTSEMGLELRFIDQTALGLYTAFRF